MAQRETIGKMNKTNPDQQDQQLLGTGIGADLSRFFPFIK